VQLFFGKLIDFLQSFVGVEFFRAKMIWVAFLHQRSKSLQVEAHIALAQGLQSMFAEDAVVHLCSCRCGSVCSVKAQESVIVWASCGWQSPDGIQRCEAGTRLYSAATAHHQYLSYKTRWWHATECSQHLL